jgi:hypothetical protein
LCLAAALPLATALAAAEVIPATTTRAARSPALSLETLDAVGGLPAHIAGRFPEMTDCEQTSAGEYFVFDRRSHAVFSVAPPYDTATELVQIGAEAGRLLRPSAFALGGDGSFVVVDAPNNMGRVQVFLTGGANVGAFMLPTRDVPTMVFDDVSVSGIASVAYNGKSIFISQPELGALVSEYTADGRSSRSFGVLRPTGHEQDRALHLALNTGLPLINPRGGSYFVFIGGVPAFRKYDAAGKLLFERHIEGPEVDAYITTLPTEWPRRSTDDGVLPVVRPAIRAAAVDSDGSLWVSLTTPVTYVYDASGDKRRTVQFHAAGIISPRSLFFTRNHRLLVTPGCYAFRSDP